MNISENFLSHKCTTSTVPNYISNLEPPMCVSGYKLKCTRSRDAGSNVGTGRPMGTTRDAGSNVGTAGSNVSGHCNELLGKTLYYSHKQLYYDQEARKWSRDHRAHIATEGEEFSFPPHDASHSSFG